MRAGFLQYIFFNISLYHLLRGGNKELLKVTLWVYLGQKSYGMDTNRFKKQILGSIIEFYLDSFWFQYEYAFFLVLNNIIINLVIMI